MSLHTSYSSFLSNGPKVIATATTLTIKTNWLSKLLTLGSSRRTVIIDSQQQRVTISETNWWFKSQRYELDFDEIDHLDYEADEYATSWGGALNNYQAEDGIERYTLGLVAKDEGYYKLCSYVGEGSAETGFNGVLMGDDILDYSGTQQEDSRKLVNQITDRIGIPIGKQYAMDIDTIPCRSCQRQVSPTSPRCLYCGNLISG